MFDAGRAAGPRLLGQGERGDRSDARPAWPTTETAGFFEERGYDRILNHQGALVLRRAGRAVKRFRAHHRHRVPRASLLRRDNLLQLRDHRQPAVRAVLLARGPARAHRYVLMPPPASRVRLDPTRASRFTLLLGAPLLSIALQALESTSHSASPKTRREACSAGTLPMGAVEGSQPPALVILNLDVELALGLFPTSIPAPTAARVTSGVPAPHRALPPPLLNLFQSLSSSAPRGQ